MRHSLTIRALLTALVIGFLRLNASATTYYVDINSPNPTPPYTDWSIAATNIQNAIDASINGDTVIVTDGVYQVGGEVINGQNGVSVSNRVAINKSITVQSVNGPAATTIQGFAVPPGSLGGVRCVYMTNNTALIGFTLSGGSTVPFADSIHDGSGGGAWCETNTAILSNCVITANSASYAGGGVYQGTLLNCTVSQNSIVPYYSGIGEGGGVYQSILVDCLVISNSITNVYYQGITFALGGGAYNSELTNCVVADNFAAPAFSGGGGGTYQGTSVNCTITGNSAYYGGGTFNSALINCINYYNTSEDPSSPNYYSSALSYCCTTPLPNGPGNITNAPVLASISCISTNSPCRGAGTAAAATGVDINGNPWAYPPSIGCDEPYPGNVVGTNLTAGISTAYNSYPPGYAANFQANISGPVSASVWNFGDGTTVTNMPFVSHFWPAVGSYLVTLTAYNDSYPTGVMATMTINVSTSLVYYADLNSHYPSPPYRTWSSAAATIQDAVNAANAGSLVLVTNGTTHAPNTNNNALYYNGGMTAPNGTFYRVVVTNPITVESVHGPSSTLIAGSGPGVPTGGCAYLTNGATLIGFTITNGDNGGIFATSTNVLITNCVITHCSGGNGGIISGTLVNCLITNTSGTFGSVGSNCIFVLSGEQDCLLDNCVISNGGGHCAYGGILNNCLITRSSSSSAAYGDAVFPIVLNNCIISNNGGGGASGASSFNNYAECILNNCIVVSNLLIGPGGAGAYQAQLNNCIISSNRQTSAGAVANCLLTNCSIIANPSGGAYDSVLNNCTIANNLVIGATFSTLNDCIVSNNLQGGISGGVATGCLIIGNQSGVTGAGASGGTLNQCVILGNICTNGEAGGGAAFCNLNNCLISSNMVLNAANFNLAGGGGVYSCKLTNCILTYNFSATNGGAAYQSTLVNCTVAFNSSILGGGIFDCHADNCILYNNSGGDFSPNTSQYPLNYCCSPVLATNGFFNITNAPLFVNAAANDFHLQSTSPCINAGNNAYISFATDFDGNPRVKGGTVDIGAYEYQTPTSIISYAYLQQYGLPTDGSVDSLDLDGSGFTVYQDWVAGLNPTNSASVLVMLPVTTTNTASGIKVMWQSVSGINYNLQRSTNLVAQPPFSTIQSNIIGNTGTTSYTDTSATNGIPYFYRVGVQAP